MNQRESKLMNFRIPVELKEQFNQLCEIKNIKMSYQLKKLIKSFIDKESKKQIKPIIKNEPKQWGHLIQDPVTKVWSSIRGY